VEYDVAIIGYGPTGETAALLLGQLGVRTVVLERDLDPYSHARAVAVDDEVLRIWQRVGLAERLKADMRLDVHARWKTPAGRITFETHPTRSDCGHTPLAMIYQPAMDAVLREAVAGHQSVDVRLGEEVTAIDQDSDRVRLTTRRRADGREQTVTARYALACDGGSSGARTALGIRLTGATYEEPWVVIDAKVKRWWPEHAALTFWADRERPAVDIPTALGHHRWEFPLREGESREDAESEEFLWRFLRTHGVTPEHVEIVRHVVYVHHLRRAEHWRSGRVLLLGDAAHMTPPWAGQGMCAGVRDASNLTWKVAAVLRGMAPESLLDTYQTEREPHVHEMQQVARFLGWLIGARNPLVAGARDWGCGALHRLPVIRGWVRELGFRRKPRLRAGFGARPAARANPIGRLLPQPRVATLDGRVRPLDDVLGPGFAVLGLGADPREGLPPGIVAAWERLDPRWLTVRPVEEPLSHEGEIADVDQTLVPLMRRYGATHVAVRPDRYVFDAGRHMIAPPWPQPQRQPERGQAATDRPPSLVT
jgi:3-(3-hydroxy-phenyl)propionate hydroxylase